MKKSLAGSIILILFSLLGLYYVMVVYPSQKDYSDQQSDNTVIEQPGNIVVEPSPQIPVTEEKQSTPEPEHIVSEELKEAEPLQQIPQEKEQEFVDPEMPAIPEAVQKSDESAMPDVPEQEKISKEEHELVAKYPAGNTPEEAWKNLVELWNNKEKGWDYGIFTDVGKFIRQIYTGTPPDYINKTYTIYQKGDYAIVTFEKMRHPPIFFCNTEEGWKFDLVHQRRLVKEAGYNWGIEKYITPYVALLRRFPVYFRIDIPFEDNDRYSIARDKKLAEELQKYEEIYKSGKMNYEEGLFLARLYAITTLGYRAIPILEHLKEKIPDNPDVYKYMAIAQVDSTLEYEKALDEIKKYIEMVPGSQFGHEFLGYMLLQTTDYEGAEAEFKKALDINPKSCYSFAKLSLLYKNIGNQENFNKSFMQARETCTGISYERVIWLIQIIHKEKRSLNENYSNK